MLCRKITLTDFRNIEYAEVDFCEGVNVLHGDNAQGKTNLLEAVYYAAIGKSFRSQHAPDIIRFGKSEAFVSLDYFGRGREQNISVRIFKDKARQLEKNRVKMRKMSEIVGEFRAVLFCPEHLSLVKDGPSERRGFLDIAISTIEPLYLASLQRYSKILQQRNALIRAAQKDRETFESTVDVWSAQLAHEAALIARSRMRYVKKANRFVAECFADMMGDKEKPQLIYEGPGKLEEDAYEDIGATEQLCYSLLSNAHEREIGAGSTLYGVHKDDVEVLLNGRSARLYASQGQQRSLALALKMAEGEICREDCGEYPVLLLDDVLSELDSGRRAYLLNQIEGKQVIMTTCEREGAFANHRITVENGRYTAI